jgi:hypothetical protein
MCTSAQALVFFSEWRQFFAFADGAVFIELTALDHSIAY